MSAQVLVISGDGVNCERETARAFEEEGATTRILHINEFLKRPRLLLEQDILCFPGGFSFGDELRSGKILAEKMRADFSDTLQKYTDENGLTIGICNGFQVLIQLGVFGSSGFLGPRTATLATSDHGKFLNRWVEVEFTEQAKKSPWFQGMKKNIFIPMRHKEGRIVAHPHSSLSIPLRYTENVNGSYENAAALLDTSGRILGLMPHPEAATHAFLCPSACPDPEANAQEVRKIFKNAIAFVHHKERKQN